MWSPGFRSLLFFRDKTPTCRASVSCNLAAGQQNSFVEKGLVRFAKNCWNNFFFCYECWQGTSFNLSLSQELRLQDVSIYLHWKAENIEGKSSPKASPEADSTDEFSVHDSGNCFTLSLLWGKKKEKGLIMNLVCIESNHVKSRSCNLIYAEVGTSFHAQKRECAANGRI